MGRRKRKLLILAVLFLCGIGPAMFYVYFYVVAPKAGIVTECDQLMTKMVSDACAHYSTRFIDGNFCPRFCNKKEFKTLRCLNDHVDKMVILLQSRGAKAQKVVLKYTPTEGQIDRTLLNLKSSTFVSLVNETLRHNLGTVLLGLNSDDELNRLWNLKTSDFIRHENNKNNKNNDAAREQVLFTSLWPLLQQTEYLNCKYFERDRLFPRIEGSCGSIYFVEYVSSSISKAISSGWDWDVTREYVMKLIDFILRLDYVYKEQIHLCDVKDEHFQLDSTGNVVFIDSDMVHAHSRLTAIFANTECTTNDHCNYFDCHGYCNVQTNKCIEERTNTNMQALVEKVLLGTTGPGLLETAPHFIRTKLLEAAVDLRQHPYMGDELRRMLSPLQLLLSSED